MRWIHAGPLVAGRFAVLSCFSFLRIAVGTVVPAFRTAPCWVMQCGLVRKMTRSSALALFYGVSSPHRHLGEYRRGLTTTACTPYVLRTALVVVDYGPGRKLTSPFFFFVDSQHREVSWIQFAFFTSATNSARSDDGTQESGRVSVSPKYPPYPTPPGLHGSH